jgi:hypothetical protein
VACGQGLPTTVAGTFQTEVTMLQFDTAQVELSHKRDVDPWEDGCIAMVQVQLSMGAGCRLRVLAGGRYLASGGLAVLEVEFEADSWCPGFPDPTEGVYMGTSGLQVAEVVPGVREVPGNNLAESCVRTTFTVRLAGRLTRVADGQALQISPSELVVSGEHVSLGSFDVSCPCLPSCVGRVCGDDGCGGSCGTCQGAARCSSDGQCLTAGPDTCWQGSVLRPKAAPQVGDLVVVELMPDPAAVADTDGEWFELAVLRSVDLNGLRWGQSASSTSLAVPEGDCFRVEAGRRLLAARSADPQVNGGLPEVDRTFSFSLTNSNGGLALVYAGSTLDAAAWGLAAPGVALSLDARGEDPVRNDDPFYWCPASTPYGLGDLGSPGAPNPSCDLPERDCTEGGVARLKVPPVEGDVVITEIMADPNGSDALREWFEIVVRRDVDLNGLMGGREALTNVLVPEGPCVRVAAGSRLVFARNADSAQNGGLPEVAGVFSFNLLNSASELRVGLEDLVLDWAGYAAPTAGRAWSLAPTHEDPVQNDSPSSWCLATTVYGAADNNYGTPGAANPACP